MAGSLYIPGADRTSRWFLDNYPSQLVMPRIDKDLLHSTETNKRWPCPGYLGGGTAPQVTINPWSGYQKVTQHFPINRAGRALLNPTSTPVSENRDNVFQVEITGYSDPVLGKAAGCYLPDLSDAELQYIADVLIFVHKEWPHPTTLPPTWPLYKVSSWAAMKSARMTSAQYDEFRGILGHLHASGNDHSDVAIRIQTLKAQVDRGLATPKPPKPSTTYAPYPGHLHSIAHRSDGHVGLIQTKLKAFGLYKMKIDNHFGLGTKAAVIAFQKSQKVGVDGIVGPVTWGRLKIPR